MMTEAQFLQWCETLHLPPDTCRLIASRRAALPVRPVQGRAHNVRGRYPSRKMGVTIQFESQTPELWAIISMDHDPEVLEFFDQPITFPLHYRSKSGRRASPFHTPDFLVLRTTGACVEEWKTEAALWRLAEEQPERYQRTEAGSWRCPPGEIAAGALGLTYRLHSSDELHPTFIQNLLFLEEYWRAEAPVDPAIQALVLARLQATPGITLAALLGEEPALRANEVYALLAQEQLWVDLEAAPLGSHHHVRLYSDQATVEAQRLSGVMTSAPWARTSGSPTAPALNTELLWGGQRFRLVELGETTTTLLPPVGPLLPVPTPFFSELLERGMMVVPMTGTEGTLSAEVRERLASASPADLAEANRRFYQVQAYLQRRYDLTAATPRRTLERWAAQFRAAERRTGCGYVGLLPQTAARGNRTPKAPEASLALLEEMIRTQFETPRQQPARAVYLLYTAACQQQGFFPLSERSFYRRLKQRAGPEQTRKRQGTRAAYGESPPYPVLTQTTPRHGDRPWAIGHLDHTELDIELVSSATGKPLGRPWATFLLDAYSRRLLALYLTFDKPSYRSCMVTARLCVRQHGRLPQIVFVDGGKEFGSVYFETLLAHYQCLKKTRPSGEPRFGSVIERLFGTANTQFIHTLLGNTQATKVPRLATRAVDPKRLAVWTLPDLYDQFWTWAEEIYHQTEHPALGQSPLEAYQAGLAQSGEREHWRIPYDETFLMLTRPSTRKGTAKVWRGRGIKLHHLTYWNDALRQPEVEGTQVPVRYDPFDLGVAYAFVQHRWVECISQYYTEFHGHSERELEVAATELLRRTGGQRTVLDAKRLAEFLTNVQAHEALLLQRMRDLETRQILQRQAGTDDEVMAGEAIAPSAARPSRKQAAPAASVLSPVDLDSLPVFEVRQQ